VNNCLKVVFGDITTAKVDAIVNAAKPSLMGGSGVDGAIHRAAGADLLEKCMEIKAFNGVRCPTGQVRITGSGNLSCKYVIHAVGPIYSVDETPSLHLECAYKNSIKAAKINNCKSIAFPAISCGKYGYPYLEAVKIAVATCRNSTDIDIYFYVLDSKLLAHYTKALSFSMD